MGNNSDSNLDIPEDLEDELGFLRDLERSCKQIKSTSDEIDKNLDILNKTLAEKKDALMNKAKLTQIEVENFLALVKTKFGDDLNTNRSMEEMNAILMNRVSELEVELAHISSSQRAEKTQEILKMMDELKR